MSYSQSSIKIQPYPQLTGIVENIYPYGISVKISDSKSGYIRKRELSIDGDISPKRLVKVGDELPIVLLEPPKNGLTGEYSHKQTLPDPWLTFVTKYKQGDVIRGIVKKLQPYGAYVRVMSGVDGLVELSELSRKRVAKPEDILLRGDHVEAIITHLNVHDKKLNLSIRRRLAQLSQVNVLMDYLVTKAHEQIQLETKHSPFEEITEQSIAEAESLLIVEDNKEIREGLLTWLSRRGYKADIACSSEEAKQSISRQTYHILLVDIDLQGEDGLVLIRYLKQREHEVRFIVMSAHDVLSERADEIAELGIAHILPKPLHLPTLEHILVDEGRDVSIPVNLQKMDKGLVKSFRTIAQTMESHNLLTEQLQESLDYLLETTGAQMGIIFHLNPITLTVQIVTYVGQLPTNQDALYSLSESPVNDVIKSKYPVFERNVLKFGKGKFRKLLDFIDFQSCIGVPITANGKTDHALFLFHTRQRMLTRFHQRNAIAMATLFSTTLEREAFEARIHSISDELLQGQLGAGFSHEINNKLSALELQVQNFALAFETGLPIPHQTSLETSNGSIPTIHQILDSVQELKKTAWLFQSLSRQRDKPQIDVHQTIRQVIYQMKPDFARFRIKSQLRLVSHMPFAVGSSIHLRHVLLNIILNALQHMQNDSQKGCIIQIQTLFRPEETLPIKIRVMDTGPGIHRQSWKQIFDMGYSTREEGTGLGLYIAQSLLQNVGGRIILEESIMLIGTTFLIELPVIPEEGENE